MPISQLAVQGRDLLELGFQPGPFLGRALHTLLGQVRAGKAPNEKGPLLDLARKLLARGGQV